MTTDTRQRAIEFLREKKLLNSECTQFIISYPTGESFDVVELITESCEKEKEEEIWRKKYNSEVALNVKLETTYRELAGRFKDLEAQNEKLKTFINEDIIDDGFGDIPVWVKEIAKHLIQNLSK